MTAIKICGIKTEEIALETAKAGADFIGLVFAASPRQVTPAEAEKITSALKNSKVKTQTVGVFVNERITTVRKIADTCHLDWVQLSGNEPWEYCVELGRPVIKAVKVNGSYGAAEITRQISNGKKLLGEKKHMILLDSGTTDKYGGTGLTFNWDLAKPIAEKFQVIIGGGLNPGNVGRAIKHIKPWGVDVSSGVETKGAKDMKKILEFIKAVRETDDG